MLGFGTSQLKLLAKVTRLHQQAALYYLPQASVSSSRKRESLSEKLAKRDLVKDFASTSPNTVQKKHLASSTQTSTRRDDNSVASLPFDQLTQMISKGDLNKAELPESLKRQDFDSVVLKLARSDYDNLRFPFDFAGRIQKQKDQNVQSPIVIEKIISYETIMSIYKSFLDGLVENNTDLLKTNVETYFLSKLQPILKGLKQKNHSVELRRNVDIKEDNVELFNVNLILGNGLSTNRKKNRSILSYNTIDTLFRDCPITVYLKKKPGHEETARMKIQLEFSVRSCWYLVLMRKGEVVVDYNGKDGDYWHHLVLEGDLLELTQRQFKGAIAALNSGEGLQLTEYKNLTKEMEWKLIDFDGFMEGNPLLEYGARW